MTRTFFLAISMLPVSAYAQTGAASDWTGYYMLTTVRRQSAGPSQQLRLLIRRMSELIAALGAFAASSKRRYMVRIEQ